MASLKDLANEAVTVLDALNSRVESNVLAKASTLRPQVVSIAKRIQDLMFLIKKILVLIADNYGDTKPPKVILIEPLWSIIALDNRLAVARHKPSALALSYSKDNEEVTVKSKGFAIAIQAAHMELGRLRLTVELDPADPSDLHAKLNDVKYVLKDVIPPLELMLLSLEKKLGRT